MASRWRRRVVIDLLRALCDADCDVSLETSGALDVADRGRARIEDLDLKTPGSGEMARNLWANLDHLTSRDEIKFVLCDRADYEWARSVLQERALAQRCAVLFSPSYRTGRSRGSWRSGSSRTASPVRMQLQLHKVLWGETPGR